MSTILHIRLIPLLFLAFFFSRGETIAQTKIDTTTASHYYKKADSLLMAKNYEESILFFNKALPIYQKAQAWEKVAMCHNRISGNARGILKLKEALEHAEKALSICTIHLEKNHKEKALSYDHIGHHYRFSSDYDKAMMYFKKALAIRRKSLPENHIHLAISNTNIGSLYYYKSEYRIAIQYFEKALAINLKILDPDDQKIGMYYSNLAIIYDELGEFNKALEYYNKDLILSIKRYGENHKEIASIYNNLGVTYINLEQYDNALNYYKKALTIDIEKIDLESLMNIYTNIGLVFKNRGEYDKAIQYQKKSLDINLKNLGEHHPKIAANYINIGVILKNQGYPKKALEYFNKALQNLNSFIDKNQSRIAEVLDNIGAIHHTLNKYDIALKYYKEALSIRENIFDKDNFEIARTYAFMADTYLKMGIYDDAQHYYNKELTILQNLYGANHTITSKSYHSIAMLYKKQKRYVKAINHFNKALISNSKNEDVEVAKNIFDHNQYYNPTFLVEILRDKAKTLQLKYLEHTNTSDLEQSIVNYKKADITITQIRQSLQNYQDKVFFAKQAKEVYADAIKAYLLLHKETKEKHALLEAFYYVEKSKANTLKELLTDANAKNFTGLSSEILETEKLLKTNRAFYQSQIIEELSNTSTDTTKIKDYENNLFSINRQQDSLTQALEKNYPKYHQLKYSNDIIKVSDIQQKLDDKTTLLELFTADSSTYAFTISKHNLAVQELSTPGLATQIEEFRESITAKNTTIFKQKGYALYNKLIQPIKDKLVGNELIIIPDGPLWHLNFELLLSQNDVSKNPGELSYLLKDYAITYANSANLLFKAFKQETSKDRQESCLAFSFSDSINVATSKNMSLATLRDAGDDLPGTRKEIKAISKIIDGQYYFGAEASEANFKKNVEYYNILHLALHGEVDNEKPENSKLFFTKSKDTIEDNLLYAHELFALDIPSDLTVLSACNTGTGKIAKGEGIMSLGNAFQYAGTKSLLLSSWEVPDDTAPKLMQYFYTNLKAGMNKGKALQQAKLSYLETADRYHKAPFYWGGFYLVGDSAPIQFSTTNFWGWVLGFGILGMILLGVFLYKRKTAAGYFAI